jgi:hypothetical protein
MTALIKWLYQTSCSADGQVIAWDISNGEGKMEKVLDGIIPVVKDAEYDTAISS